MADDPPIVPTAFLRRSFVYRTLQRLGAEFAVVNGAAVALRCGAAVDADIAAGRRLGLAYVGLDQSELGSVFDIKVAGGGLIQGRVVPIPFYDPENKRQEM